MAFVVRRVFVGKVGVSDQLVAHIREVDNILEQQGVNMKRRTLTDHQSGRTDRVVVEWEVNSLRDYEEAMGKLMSNPESKQAFDTWMAKLSNILHYAEVETWAIQ